MEKIIQKIAALKERWEQTPADKDAAEVSREKFTLLLSGVSTCRKMPGVPRHMGYEELYHCTSDEDIRQGREHMEYMFGIRDKESLMQACYQIYSGSHQYEQFMTFWKEAPMFDIHELNQEGLKRFTRCKNLAERFYPFVKEKGFYAWDINERIGLCRKAVACGLISGDEFWDITDAWVRQAQVFYHSYGEYAVSCLCGALYDMALQESDISGFFEINCNVIGSLLDEGGAWRRNRWYVPQEREWAQVFGSNSGCFITKKAIEENYIGYMYRDEPCPGQPDSGWRFFYGNEPDAYVNNVENVEIWGLEHICNLYPDIMAYLYAGVGREFGRGEDGWHEE